MYHKKGLDDYVLPVELAKKHGISTLTVLRRVKEGNVFPGAKKVQLSFGERWLIPRAEAESVSLQELSPRKHSTRRRETSEPSASTAFSGPSTIDELEQRVSVLEKLLLDESSFLDPVPPPANPDETQPPEVQARATS